jgi:ubiquinone/menaquinone biosynthesis C-methylase UbiE
LSVGLSLAAIAVWAQPATDPEVIARALFPKDEGLQHMHLGQIASRLGVHAGSQVADVGCGDGTIALIWSRVFGPFGHVWAAGTDPPALKAARKLMKKQGARNVTVVQGQVSDPQLPASRLDGITLFFVYHELVQYPEMLAHFRQELKPDGRLVIVDSSPHKTAARPRATQTKNHVLRPDIAADELRQAGFEALYREDHFIDNPDAEETQWLLATRPIPKPDRADAHSDTIPLTK